MSASIHHPDDLHEHLDRWVSQSLISHAEAEAIERFEAGAPVTRRRRTSFVTEALAYLGFALAAAAGGVWLADVWPDLQTWEHLLVTGGLALVLFVAGSVLGRTADPAIARLSSVLSALSVAAFAWFAWLLAHDQLGWTARASALAAGAASLVLATGIWAFRPRALQQAAMFGACIMTLIGAAPTEQTAATIVWAFAIVWAVAAGLGRLEPARAGVAMGSIAALWAPISAGPAGMWMGLAAALAILAASIPRRDPGLLGLGAIGTFLYLVRVVARLFGDTVGVPIALLVLGVGIVALAVWLARSDRFARGVPRDPAGLRAGRGPRASA